MEDRSLAAWTCSKCGAALPKPEHGASAVKCAACGTMFQISQAEARSGGIQISGNIVVHGDIVGGDRITIVNSTNDVTVDKP
jgi:predicted RNA-binding Zn-ribbon protein involved in translation (DUF1610 family)